MSLDPQETLAAIELFVTSQVRVHVDTASWTLVAINPQVGEGVPAFSRACCQVSTSGLRPEEQRGTPLGPSVENDGRVG